MSLQIASPSASSTAPTPHIANLPRMHTMTSATLPPMAEHLNIETNQLTVDTLLEVARLTPKHQRQAQLALEVINAKSAVVPNPDLDQVQVAGIAEPQQQQVTNVLRRLLAAQRILGGHGTIVLIRRAASAQPETGRPTSPQAGSNETRVDSILYTGDQPGGLKRILLFSLDDMSWRVTHLSVYVLPKLHSHFAHGIQFETPALRYPLLPFTDAFDAKTRLRVAQKWTSDKLSDRLLAIQKLGQLMPALYFGVVDQFLRGTAAGTVDKAFQFAITVPAIVFDPKTLIHLPFFRERRHHR